MTPKVPNLPLMWRTLAMLTDVFVPLFTYPEETATATLPQFIKLLEAFATRVTYCGVEIDVPDLANQCGARLAALPQMAAEVERRSHDRAVNLLEHAKVLATTLEASTFRLRAAFIDPGRSGTSPIP